MNKSKKERKENFELGVATAIIMGYLVILTYAALAGKTALALWDTAVFGCLVYICWRADKEEKARLRHREARNRVADQVLAELEEWREQQEAD